MDRLQGANGGEDGGEMSRNEFEGQKTKKTRFMLPGFG